MANDPVRQQNAGYRKGLVLGLTLAEIMLLLLFVLLLVLAGLLLDLQRDLKERDKEVAQLKVDNIAHGIVLQEIKEVYGEGGNIDDLFKELVKTNKQIEKIKNDSALVSKKFDEVSALLDDLGVDTSTIETIETQLKEMDDVAQVGRSVKDEYGVQAKDIAKTLIEKNKELEARSRNQEGQIINLRAEIKRQGGGEGYPPCWVSANGKAEYIFDVVLTDVGMVVHDNKLPHRVEEQARLPVAGVVFEEEVSGTRFMKLTYPIFEWSVQNECRFYVKLIDGTGPTNKVAYKRHREAVENRFYIKLAGSL